MPSRARCRSQPTRRRSARSDGGPAGSRSARASTGATRPPSASGRARATGGAAAGRAREARLTAFRMYSPSGGYRSYPDPVRLRRPSPGSLLAWAAALVGVIGIASALTPEMRDRFQIVGGVLPPGGIAAARVGALAFGIALVWLSRSLARRRHRAWQLAVLVVIASAVAHMAKGLDFEESTASLVLLVALVRYRRRFDVPGEPGAARPLLGVACTLAAAVAVGLGVELHGGEIPDRLSDFFTALGIVLGFGSLYLWLRPLSHAVAVSYTHLTLPTLYS